jgi:NADPH-dependent 2,4-dienoyl-CoA reductase/sulfur reductase-like enzyme
MADATYLIVGNGTAGITAAQEIRHADPDARILVVGDEGEPYYYRASLSEWISGQTADEMLPGRTPEFYEQMRIEQVDGHVVRVDPAANRVHLADGGTIGYDQLLIATGARANVHPIAGLKETDVLVFRSLADARKIKERLGCCGRALIVGGGILGLELVGALTKMDVQSNDRPSAIAVVQRTPPLGKPLLDAPAAEWLQERMEADGVELFIRDTVARVDGQTAHLKSGRAWDFDVLVQAIGITPVFPQVPGLAAGKGIRIDERCRTNLPGIYAAGDCTETRVPSADGRDAPRWQTTRIWLDCALQGKVAGRNMAGQDTALPNWPFFNASIIYTVLYTYVGEPHGEEGRVYVWQESADGNRLGGYRKVRVVDGKLAGALLLGERHGSMALFKAIGQPVAQFGADIAHPDFPFNDLTGRDWDYVFY